MSVETDFRAALAAHAPLVALVGSRIAQDAVPDGATYPLVVFSVRCDPALGLDGAAMAEQCALSVQCWANSGSAAAAVADAVVGAVVAAEAAGAYAYLNERSTSFDEELGLDAVLLTVEWWAV